MSDGAKDLGIIMEKVAAAAVTHKAEQGAFLGTLATVADGEGKGLALALSSAADKLLILSDSMAGIQALVNLSRGAPPRSGIEKELKLLFRERAHQETAIGWDMGRFRHTNLGKEDGEEEEWDAVESYFAYLYRPLAGR
ncbi:hypothetical protein EV426DRAFT_702707 [Tirmania nivea]|nr:hypothetical protein EV426DRAFT_702707 [Tirmania nivea]